MTAKEQALVQINILQDTIDARRITSSDGIGAHFAHILVQVVADKAVESAAVMQQMIDKNKSIGKGDIWT